MNVELGKQVLQGEVAVGALSIHWNAACGTLHAQRRMAREFLEAFEAYRVSLATLARFADEMKANSACKFQEYIRVEHTILQQGHWLVASAVVRPLRLHASC